MESKPRKERWSASRINVLHGEIEIATFAAVSQSWVLCTMEGGYLYTIACKVATWMPVAVKAPPIEDEQYPLYLDVMRALRSRGYTDVRDG